MLDEPERSSDEGTPQVDPPRGDAKPRPDPWTFRNLLILMGCAFLALLAANFLATIGSVMPIQGSTEGVPIPPARITAFMPVPPRTR